MSELPTYDQISQLPVLTEHVVPPEFIDTNGHMNIRHYFDTTSLAVWHLVIDAGIDQRYNQDRELSLFTVEQHLTYFRELNRGERFAVHGRLLARSGKALHAMAFVVAPDAEALTCTFEVSYVHVSTRTRRAVDLPDDVGARLDAAIAAGDALGWDAPVCGAMGIRRSHG